MSDVEFNEPSYGAAPVPGARARKSITEFVIKMGLASDETQAQYVLLGAVIVAILLAIVIFHFASPHTGGKLSPEAAQQIGQYLTQPPSSFTAPAP